MVNNLKIKKETILKIGLIFVLSLMVFTISIFYKKFDNSNKGILYSLAYDTNDYVYLSDLNYIASESYVEDGYYLHLDKNNSSGLITVNIDGRPKEFIKGISAWATSNLVYDISGYDYDYFVSYIGVDEKEKSTYYNSGVTFTIYTSNDGVTWNEAYKSGVKKGLDDADYIKIPLENVNYLKLYAYENGDSWYSMWYDDAVYADAKLIKDGYVESVEDDNTIVKKISDYDALIKKYESEIKDGTFTNIDKYALTLLQRDFVTKAGYNVLQALLKYSDNYKTVLSWLMNDKETLELYVLGGEPDGNYATSLSILNELYFKYKDTDLNNNEVTKNGVVLKDLYKKMIVSLSLTHSANVGLWVSLTNDDSLDPNGSNALNRYEIFKKLHHDGLLIDEIFENLSVEEMRFVMNNIIDDEEIIWLNHYTTENNSKNPYTYITYRFGYDYNNPKYYVEENKNMWNNKKRGNLPYAYNFKDYGITYATGYPKLWIVFEEGSVCGGLSKTGSNIWGSYGVPSSVVSQPGHAAYIYMSLDENGNKVWNLYNDVSGWGQSGKTEKLSIRMPNGWGSGDYASAFPASYIVLAEASLQDFDNYKLSEEILMSADIYSNDYQTLDKIYRAALNAQKINFDAWLGLVNNYEKLSKSESDYYNLALEITQNLGNYPLPMYDLLKIISSHLKTADYKARYLNLLETALTKATLVDDNVVNDNVKRQVANYLLNANKDSVATFSFDGENAGKIMLSKSFDGNGVNWQYNLKSSLSENDWKDASGLTHELTKEELDLIHEETDIHIRFVGALDVVYDIPIEKAIMPTTVGINDYENTFMGINKDKMEWQYENDSKWIKFSEEEPILNGNVSVNVRVGRYQNYTESDFQTFTFTNIEEDEINKYIPIKRLTVDSVSSEELEKENNAKENVIDGNINTLWHTKWDGSDKEKYIILKLDTPSYITSLEYIPRQNSTNGIILNAKILVSMDKENWIEVVSETDWDLNNLSKKVMFNKVEKALYVKIIGSDTVGDYMSAAMINLFEDSTKNILPKATISYSTQLLTNKDVIVKLINPNKDITITNNNGSDTYIFKDNGEFTFEFEDQEGNKGFETAKVTWIDKIAPSANIKYNITSSTTKNVEAELISNEEIIVKNNNGSKIYTFTKNGTFEFIFSDLAGNESKIIANVSWIKSNAESNSNSVNDNVDSENTDKEDNEQNNEDNIITDNSSDTKVLNDNNSFSFIELAMLICISLIVILTIIYIILKRRNKSLD